MNLDHLSRIFQNLNGMGDNIAIEFNDVDGNAEVCDSYIHIFVIVCFK